MLDTLVQPEILVSQRMRSISSPHLSTSLEDLVAQILNSHRITRAEEDRLMSALSSTSDEELKAAIYRIFYGMRHGLLQVVD